MRKTINIYFKKLSTASLYAVAKENYVKLTMDQTGSNVRAKLTLEGEEEQIAINEELIFSFLRFFFNFSSKFRQLTKIC